MNPSLLRRVTLAAHSLSAVRARPRCSRPGPLGPARRRCALEAVESCNTSTAILLAHARKTVAVTVGPDTIQVAVETSITVTAARTTSRDIRRHKASNYG